MLLLMRMTLLRLLRLSFEHFVGLQIRLLSWFSGDRTSSLSCGKFGGATVFFQRESIAVLRLFLFVFNFVFADYKFFLRRCFAYHLYFIYLTQPNKSSNQHYPSFLIKE